MRLLHFSAAMSLTLGAIGTAAAAPVFGTLADGWFGSAPDAAGFTSVTTSQPDAVLGLRAAASPGSPASNNGAGGLPSVTYTVTQGSGWTLDVSVYSGEGTLRDTNDDPAYDITLSLAWSGGSQSFDLYPLGIDPGLTLFQSALDVEGGLPSFGFPGLGLYTATLTFTNDSMLSSSLSININVIDSVSVPEPGSIALAGLALGGLALSRRRRG